MKILIFVLLPFNIFLQNLVPNHSFEDYDTCPYGESQINFASPWNSFSSWSDENCADYSNACSIGYCGVPYNATWFGFQYAYSGNAYAGIFALNGFGSNYREYLKIQMNETLTTYSCYFVEFYVNLTNNLKFAINNISMYFSQNEVKYSNTSNIFDIEPQVYKFKNPIISDTMNWVNISGIYEAQGGEQFLTIGNFKQDDATDTNVLIPNAYFAAFYYIDDVSVIPINPSTMPANAGEDKLVAPGDSVFIGQEITNLNCTWRLLDGTVLATNISGIYVKPNQKTTYLVEQNLCGNISYDTVEVNVGFVGLTENIGYYHVIISPNPNNGNFKIELKNEITIESKVRIFDGLGKTVWEYDEKCHAGKVSIYTNLAKGVYILQIETEKHKVNEKIVVE